MARKRKKKRVDISADGLDTLEREWSSFAPDGGRDVVALVAEVRRLRTRYEEPTWIDIALAPRPR